VWLYAILFFKGNNPFRRIVIVSFNQVPYIYWRVDTFTKYLGGFLVAPKGILIDGNKIIE
jgi:hypothetical protein